MSIHRLPITKQRIGEEEEDDDKEHEEGQGRE